MLQAKMPGNDRMREIDLTLNTVREALSMPEPTPNPKLPLGAQLPSDRAEAVNEFMALCELLPADVYWGEPLNPYIVRHIRDSLTASQMVICHNCGRDHDSHVDQRCPSGRPTYWAPVGIARGGS